MLERTLFEGNCRRQQERKTHDLWLRYHEGAHEYPAQPETHLSARTSLSFSAQFIPLFAAVETFFNTFSHGTQQLGLWDGWSPFVGTSKGLFSYSHTNIYAFARTNE